MEPMPISQTIWPVSLACSVISLIPCVGVMILASREPLLRSWLPLFTISLNALWALLHIGSITLSLGGVQLPCLVLGPLEHFLTCCAILWFAVVLVGLQRTMCSNRKRISFWEQLQYILGIVIVSAVITSVGLFDNLGFIQLGPQAEQYQLVSSGICFMSPHTGNNMRFYAISTVAFIVLLYICIASAIIVVQVHYSRLSQALKSSIRRKCVRYITLFIIIWGVWMVSDAKNILTNSRPSEGVQIAQAALFFLQGVFPSLLYGANKWPEIRPLMPRWFVTIMSKVGWILELAFSLLLCNTCTRTKDASVDYGEHRLVDGAGDAWDIAVEVADAIEASLPKRRTMHSEISLQRRGSGRASLQAHLLGDQRDGNESSLNSPPINIPASAEPRDATGKSTRATDTAAEQRQVTAKPSSYARANLVARAYKLSPPAQPSSSLEGLPVASSFPDSVIASIRARDATSSRNQSRAPPQLPGTSDLGKSYGSHNSLSEAEESDFDAGMFGSKERNLPPKTSMRADSLAPTRGHPVHVYHIGSYGSSSTGTDAGNKFKLAQSESMAGLSLSGALPGSCSRSLDNKQFHIAFDDGSLPSSSLRDMAHIPQLSSESPDDTDNSDYSHSVSYNPGLMPASYRTSGVKGQDTSPPRMLRGYTAPTIGSMSNFVFNIYTDDAR